jgi:hypothetical protein
VTESLARNNEEEINNEESNKSLAVHTVRNNQNIQLEENTDEDHNVTRVSNMFDGLNDEASSEESELKIQNTFKDWKKSKTQTS